MLNQSLVKIFHEIALYLEMQNVAFKPQAYEKAAVNIETLSEDVDDVYKKGGHFLLGEIFPRVRNIENRLRELKGVEKVEACGSIRRQKETIGDVDFLVASDNPKEIMDFFVSLPGVIKVWGKGATKTSVRTRNGFDMDIRVVPKESFGAALQYFTGSKEHNIILRKIAIDKGLKLSEYGLFRGERMIAGETEEEIYHLLGMDYIEPELRENQGEIEAAIKSKLPKLIELSGIKGDLHCHSHWGADAYGRTGKKIIEEMAKEAIALGYEYVGISDHTKFLHIEH